MEMPRKSRFHLELRDGHFYDQEGHVVCLRGVNLGGSTKVPFTEANGAVSFVNRPFPLEEAHEHFGRLRRWGFNFIRFLVTWEAIEHEGPGIYDKEYLAYLRQVLPIAKEYDMYIYIDPHQDVWSRWTGGDGAPLWTLQEVGLDPANFAVTKAALCQDTYGGKPEDYPKMIWPTNLFKFACATMSTLFWAGDRFAPGKVAHGQPIQFFLQSCYIQAMVQVAKVVADMDHVIGFGTMNEPPTGYIGVENLKKHFIKNELKYGHAPTPFQGMCLANGYDKKVEVWSVGFNQYILNTCDRKEKVIVGGRRAWQSGVDCVWQKAGIYDIDERNKKPRLLKPDYFANVDFGTDCYVPFATNYIQAIREVCPKAILFVEMPPLEFVTFQFPKIDIPRVVNATHWYDGVTLFLRKWIPWFTVNLHTRLPVFGRNRVRKTHIEALAAIREIGKTKMNNAPTLIGECGIPFNLYDGESYRTGNFQPQIEAMDNTISSLEANLLSYSLWCYTSDNSNRFGDKWNLEDFSLFSRDQQQGHEERDAGGRAIPGYVRPFALQVAGVPTESTFDLPRVSYSLKFTSNPSSPSSTTTIVFVPRTVHYQDGVSVLVSDGDFTLQHMDGYDLVRYTHTATTSSHSLTIKRLIDL